MDSDNLGNVLLGCRYVGRYWEAEPSPVLVPLLVLQELLSCPKRIDLLTFGFSHFGPFLVMAPKS